jgi:hypothetical protein
VTYADRLLHGRGIPIPLRRYLREGAFDRLQNIGRQIDGNDADDLLQTLELPAAEYRHNPRLQRACQSESVENAPAPLLLCPSVRFTPRAPY